MKTSEIIKTSEEFEALVSRSHEEPVLLFKHSLACGISFSALREFEKFVEGPAGRSAHASVLEIQTHRALSAEVAEVTGLRHESPQVLLLCKGAVVWDASHWKITSERLEKAVAEACSSVAAGASS